MNGPDGLYGSLVATTPDAIVTMDEAGRILFANPATVRMFGYSEAELLGEPLSIIMPERFRQQHAVGLARYLKTGERKLDWSGLRLPGLHRDGHEISLSISFGEYREDGRKIFTGILRDISDDVRREAENARLYRSAEAARVAAEQANAAKSEFLAMMSHELRTPLNAISGYAELLETGVRGELTEEQLADVHSIQRSQAHLLSIINDMLNFTKLEAGKVQFSYVTLTLDPLLGGLEELVRPQLLEKNIEYEYTSFDKRSTATLDGEKFQQIMLNLLSNAIKYTDSGGRVRLGWKIEEPDVVVHVGDTGRGIPADKLEAIFEPFVQVEPLRTRVTGGAGLGLAISQDLARQMGGSISVESRMGDGSTFSLRLPRVRPRDEVSAPAAGSPP
ncbi:MAG: PAS domain-containing sensor histidine kinase [Gemmatimonadaceae bacterium]